MMECGDRAVYLRRVAAVTAAYIAVVLAVGAAFTFKLVPPALAVPVALLPVVPFAALPFLMLAKLRTCDELQRKIQFEAMAFAFAMTAVLSLAYGFLEQFAGAPDANWVWVLPLLVSCQLVGIVMGRRRYR